MLNLLTTFKQHIEDTPNINDYFLFVFYVEDQILDVFVEPNRMNKQRS
jgi:hypothetical protein